MGRPKTEKFMATCIDCGANAGWHEGRGRVALRCSGCYTLNLREYNRKAQAKHRLAARLGRN